MQFLFGKLFIELLFSIGNTNWINLLAGGNYESMTIENVYRVFMKLVVRPNDHTDFGAYKCIANNTLGESEKVIHLHRKLSFDNTSQPTKTSDSFLILNLFRFT